MASHSWLKQGLTSLSTIKNQLTEFTTEVLQDVAQERDSNAELTTAKNRILHLEQELESRSKEVEHLRQRLRDENLEATKENQKSITCWDYSEKGDLEPDDWNWKDSSVDNVNDLCIEFSEHDLVGKPGQEEIPFSPNGSNLDVLKLTDEIKQLQAECAHWKELAKTNEEQAERNTKSATTTELEEAKREIEKLCTELKLLRNERTNMNETYPKAERTVDLWENDWGDSEEFTNENDQLSKQRSISSTSERCPDEQLTKQLDEDSIGTVDEKEKHWRVEISRLQEERDQALEELYAEHQEAMAQVLTAKESLAKICDEYRDQNQLISDELAELKAEQQSLLEENKSLQTMVDNLKDRLQTESKEKTSLFDINEQLEEHMRILKMQLTELQGKHERCAEENENAKQMLENLTVEFEQMKQAWTEEQQKHAQQTETNVHYNNTIVEMRATIEQLQCVNSKCFDKLREMIDNGWKADAAELTLERLADMVKQNQNSLLQRLHERDEQCSAVIEQLQQTRQEKLEKEASNCVAIGGLVKFLLSRDESQSRRLRIMDQLITSYRHYIGKETADVIQQSLSSNYSNAPKKNTVQYSHSFQDIATYKDNNNNVEKEKTCFINLPSYRRCKSTISIGHFDFKIEQNEPIQESHEKYCEQLLQQLQYAQNAEAEAKRLYCEVLDKLVRTEEYSNKVVEELQTEIAALGQKMIENETNSAAQLQNIQNELNNCKGTALQLAEENAQLRNQLSDTSASTVASTEQLKQIISTLEAEKQELILLINQKHEESVHYHQELQNAMATFEAWKEQQALQQASYTNQEESATVKRLNQQLAEKDAQIERLTKNVDEQLNMAIQAKDRATAELAAVRLHSETLQEQVTFLEEAKRRSFSEVERLKSHLVELEQTYSEEACRAEDRETDLRKRLRELEDQLNITLQEAQQKNFDSEKEIEELRSLQNAMSTELNTANSQINILCSELENSQKSVYSLQNVLEAFQKVMNVVVVVAIDRESSLNQQSEASRLEIEYLKAEIDTAQAANQALQTKVQQYEEMNQRVCELQSALCAKENSLSDLQTQLRERDRRLLNMEKELHQLQHVRDGKIDKDVLKNLFLGYLTAPVNKKAEVAHLIGSILSFSADEFEKVENSVGGGGGATGWLQLLRLGGTGSDVKTSSSQSLAAEFVKFLQMESSPKEQLDDQLSTAAGAAVNSTTSVSAAVKDDGSGGGGNGDNSGSGTTPFFLLSGSARSQPASSIPITLDLPTLPAAYECENIPPTTSAKQTTLPAHEQLKPAVGGMPSSSSTNFLRQLLDSDEQ
ncbi:Thyroid receptor-interacting protein 11 [Trichinella pseudospiralis]|uniref:Thyroid receptor-interacting protein 11 n=1 Tax=Trichinella pseudospiralis TaxID=6337 RepID=A0A0V1FEB9_TRIPS|nr:Thyroid receptor-interacting protein 11 [Trichinella pseudospiralis]